MIEPLSFVTLALWAWYRHGASRVAFVALFVWILWATPPPLWLLVVLPCLVYYSAASRQQGRGPSDA